MQQGIHSIILIFRDFEETIESFYESDENFRELCSELQVNMIRA